MSDQIPSYLVQGEAARLFPVLSNVSKEGRTTSIVLACIAKVPDFAAKLLFPIGIKVGARTQITSFTEVVFSSDLGDSVRPDGLIILGSRNSKWRALVEAKVGSSDIVTEQIERYRVLARENQIDCVLTISNQFATRPEAHPVEEIRRSRSRVPVFHWSWMFILTTADLLLTHDVIQDRSQRDLLNELRKFLSHESAGVKGFDKMPREWGDLNKLVASGGTIPAKYDVAEAVIDAWHQETRDLSLILSRLTGTAVVERLSRKHAADQRVRRLDELARLRKYKSLYCEFEIPGSASAIEVLADIPRRTIDVSMSVRAPTDRKSAKARVNWLLRQLKSSDMGDLHIREALNNTF